MNYNLFSGGSLREEMIKGRAVGKLRAKATDGGSRGEVVNEV